MMPTRCLDCKHKGKISGRETCRLLLRELPDRPELPAWCPQREMKEKKKIDWTDGGKSYE